MKLNRKVKRKAAKFSMGSAGKEPPKGEVMKSKLFGALVIMALALAVNANAQSKARADVPFSFIVGEKALPAGTYDVKDVAMNAIMVIRSGDGNDVAMIQFNSAEKLHAQSPKLVF